MCRSIAQGGRRCPCSQPERRSAYRKARSAATRSATIHPHPGHGGTNPPTPTLTDTWQPDTITTLTHHITALTPLLTSGHATTTVTPETCTHYPELTPVTTLTGLLDQHDPTWRDTYCPDNNLTPETVATAATILIGTAIAAEADRRAGVDPQALTREAATHRHNTETAAKHADTNYRQQRARLDAAKQQAAQLREQARDLLAKNGTPAYTVDWTHPALAELRPQQQALRTKIQTERDQLTNALNARQDAVREAVTPITPTHRDTLANLSAAYQATLTELRPIGGQLDWHERSSKPARTAFNEASNLYPTDWITQHNQHPPAIAKISKRRAHYSHQATQTKRQRQPITDITQYPETTVTTSTTPITRDDPDWREALFADPNQPQYRRTHYEPAWHTHRRATEPPAPKPRGNGWELYTDSSGETIWRRPEYRMRITSIDTIPELTTNHDPNPIIEHHSSTLATCSHELAHRFEYTVPGVSELERGFYRHRTRNETSHTRLYDNSDEYAYPDSFPAAYMGKDYSINRTNNRAYELLSCGMEALHSGKYGALLGVGRYDPDPELRAFVLGVLATAGHSN